MTTPHFLITIDTEGDNLWARPQVAATRNAAYLPRFQGLCERFALRPTYLANYEMARCLTFQRFARDLLARGAGEIGMHLHAWDSPPLAPLTANDRGFQPYLIEYPDRVMREKIRVMTATLEDAFGVKMVSHRAGRWSFDARYATMLVAEGYGVDCSVTPGRSWRRVRGAPGGCGGTDYTGYPDAAYWMDLTDISRPGDSALLEIPMTVVPRAESLVRRALRRLSAPLAPSVRWLRPNGKNRKSLLEIAARVLAERRGYAQFMLHSSELMPGGSPTFRHPAQIEAVYADLEILFQMVAGRFIGSTLSEYRTAVLAQSHAATH